MKKTILLLFLLSLIFVFGCSSNNGDNNNYKEYDSQINDIKNELSVLNEKINNLNTEKEESNRKIEEFASLIEQLDEAIDKKDSEIEKLNHRLYELLYKEQKNKEFNELICDIVSYDLSYYNLITKIQNEGVSLNDYIQYKENDQKIKGDKSLEEKLDYLYYHYNNTGSIEFLKLAISASNLSYSLDLSSGYEDIVVLKTDNNVLIFNIYENSYYLNAKMDSLKNTYLSYCENNYLSFGNVAVENKLSYIKIFETENKFLKVKEYLKDLNENITANEFITKLNDIKVANNYDYQVDHYKNEMTKNYYIGLDGKLIASVYYTGDENNLQYFDKYFWGNVTGSTEYKNNEYQYIYFHGNIAVYLLPENRNNNIEIIKNTELYKLLLGWNNGIELTN